jgi:NarL family two-component system response regulator LiaR
MSVTDHRTNGGLAFPAQPSYGFLITSMPDTTARGRGSGRDPDEPLRAIVADDDPFARRMVKDALQRAGIVVLAEAHDGREAVELTLYYRPDVVLMDVVMPSLDGIAATRQIVKDLPEQLIVLLTSADEEEMGVLGLRAGAVGFLTKDVDVSVLPRALERALDGEAVISRRLGMRLVEHLRRVPEGAPGLRPVKSPLTAREWEVIDLLYEGRTTEEIASMLVLSSETVRSHVKHILRKLGASSRGEAVALAQEMRGAPPVPPGQSGRR